jgi:hypothetical protein
MNAIDILGGLLRKKAGGSGKGADILNDIFGAGPGGRSRPAPSSPTPRPVDIEQQAKELEDLLMNAHRRGSNTTGASVPKSQPRVSAEPTHTEPEREESSLQNERATVLVRAMVNAAKSDGRITSAEQQNMLDHIEGATPEVMQFLREEFTKPLNVREFAWSVPVGMEHDVYAISLIAIDLDTDREAGYLADLAHGLRIPPSTRDQIHQQLGAPRLEQSPSN